MSCPDFKNCDQFKCHDEGVCLNANYWTQYWIARAQELKSIVVEKVKGLSPRKQSICFYCETEFGYSKGPLDSVPVKKTLDHIIPKSRGGQNIIKNYVAACGSCNMDKANCTPEEFLQLLKSGQTKRIHLNKIPLIIRNVEKLIETILPYRAELYRQGSITQEFIKEKNAESQEWPDADPELLNAFDWSKPFDPPKIGGRKRKVIDPDSIKPINPIIRSIADEVKRKEKSFGTFEAKLMKKFPYAYSQYPPDLLRWTFDNIINSKQL